MINILWEMNESCYMDVRIMIVRLISLLVLSGH